jgi:cardiolipin synthase (CMP-forming)
MRGGRSEGKDVNGDWSMSGRGESKLLNLPNSLTLMRLVLAPIFAVMILQNRAFGALLVICLAGASDVLDGYAARKLRLQTELGVLIDPLADKALGATAFVLLSLRGLGAANVIPLWLTATVLGRDLLIVLGGVIITLVRGRRKFTPTVLGKITTVLQVTTVFWVVLANYLQITSLRLRTVPAWLASADVLNALYVIALVFTVVSGVQYVSRGLRQMWPRPS